AVAKGPQVVLNAFDDGPRVIALLGLGQIRHPADRGTAIQDRARPDVAGPLLKVAPAGGDQLGREDIGPAVHLLGGLNQIGAASVVPATLEARRGMEIQLVKQRQRGYQPGAVAQPAFKGRQSEGRRGADAAAGPNQPDTDPTFVHGMPVYREGRANGKKG